MASRASVLGEMTYVASLKSQDLICMMCC